MPWWGNRGFFAELYHGQKYAAQGLDFGAARVAQENVSVSKKNVIRVAARFPLPLTSVKNRQPSGDIFRSN
jgi:hypothetical protein